MPRRGGRGGSRLRSSLFPGVRCGCFLCRFVSVFRGAAWFFGRAAGRAVVAVARRVCAWCGCCPVARACVVPCVFGCGRRRRVRVGVGCCGVRGCVVGLGRFPGRGPPFPWPVGCVRVRGFRACRGSAVVAPGASGCASGCRVGFRACLGCWGFCRCRCLSARWRVAGFVGLRGLAPALLPFVRRLPLWPRSCVGGRGPSGFRLAGFLPGWCCCPLRGSRHFPARHAGVSVRLRSRRCRRHHPLSSHFFSGSRQ